MKFAAVKANVVSSVPLTEIAARDGASFTAVTVSATVSVSVNPASSVVSSVRVSLPLVFGLPR